MLFGPIFQREFTIAPRRDSTYLFRGLYGGLLLLVTATAWLVVTGTQIIRDVGDFARFATALFQLLAPLQLVLCLFFAAIQAAGTVAQEKERQTLILLLLSHLSSREIVLGKLMSALLNVFVMIVLSGPIFLLIALLGGVSDAQIIRVLLVTLFGSLAAGSLGACVAFAREKTFQALSMTVLLLVLWLALWEAVAFGFLGANLQFLAAALSPWQAVLQAARPSAAADAHWLIATILPILPFLCVSGFLTVFINAFAIVKVRIWNPSREARPVSLDEDTWRKNAALGAQASSLHIGVLADEFRDESVPNYNELQAGSLRSQGFHGANRRKIRHAWDNPIIWREMCTRAYGRKTLIIRLAYLLFFAMSALGLYSLYQSNEILSTVQLAGPLIPLFLLSLVLVNAQAITSLTSERDGKTLDLLLVSDITPKEFVFGKLGGIFFNMKEMIALPLALCAVLYAGNVLTVWPLIFLSVGLLTLNFFVAMIGVHIGMQYDNTRSAVATSLGIIFFLFVGIASCIWIMIAFAGSFEAQFAPFLAFIVGGSIGLYATLGARNPSTAIGLAAFILPPVTFYAITSMFLGQFHLVFVSIVGAYGFTILAMLIPSIAEFDVATGRTTLD